MQKPDDWRTVAAFFRSCSLAGEPVPTMDAAFEMVHHRPPAPTGWRKEPPTVNEVKANPWWWNKPASGNPPHVLRLDVEGCRYDEAGAVVDLGYLNPDDEGVTPVIVDDGGDGEFHPFNPNDWPGEWAPAEPPP